MAAKPSMLRHLDVHQDDVERFAFESFDGLASIGGDDALVPELLEHDRRELLIDRVVLGDEDAKSPRGDFRCYGGIGARWDFRGVLQQILVENVLDGIEELRGLDPAW